jgi:adenosine kinase
MSVLISGSLAYDTVFSHEGRFSDDLMRKKLRKLNVTFQAEGMRQSFGGCAGSIASSLKSLGGDPLVWAALGRDGGRYLAHLKRLGIRTDAVSVLPDAMSAQCVITTDSKGCQLTTFHGGATNRSDELPWPEEKGIELAILAPSVRSVLLAHAAAFRAHGVPYVFDPGQTVPLLSGDEILELVGGACAAACSDYEAALIKKKTGKSVRRLSKRCGVFFCTHGAKGSEVWVDGEKTEVDAVKVKSAGSPVGAGDAYRGGLLFGLVSGLAPAECARIGSVMGALKVAGKHATLARARRLYKQRWGKPPF